MKKHDLSHIMSGDHHEDPSLEDYALLGPDYARGFREELKQITPEDLIYMLECVRWVERFDAQLAETKTALQDVLDELAD